MQAQLTRPRTAEVSPQADVTAVDAGIWNLLHSAAMSQMSELICAIHEIAAEPGKLVIVDVKRLSYHWDGWQPILFSAIDICTHLQIGRMYLTPTQASTIDFLEFLTAQYPFSIHEIRTNADPLFISPVSLQTDHQFTIEAKKKGIFHSVVLDPADHPIVRVVSKYLFGGAFEGNLDEASKESVMAGLVNFLFFHNNHRSLASLGGLTPLQKLNSFHGYEDIPWFDPYRPLEISKAGNG